jgi:hypothetical protein
MRGFSSPMRLVMHASTVVLLWLLSVSLAQAASNQDHRASGALCDEHSATIRKLIRHTKSFGGPLARRPQRALFGLSDVTARLQRGTRADTSDDDWAIQNDAPAASIVADRGAVPSLGPLGVLVGSCDRRPRTRAFSPKSPRGPPDPA